MSQNLQNFVKFQKFQLKNLVDFKQFCKTHIFLQKSEPIQPKTSNILPKFCQPTLRLPVRRIFARIFELETVPQTGSGGSAAAKLTLLEILEPGASVSKIKKISKFCNFLAGSFSAVSKRNFARKYAFDSIFQALQDLHTFAPLQSQSFRKKSV